MDRRFRTGPDPAVRTTEHEPRSFRKIQGGDAAKAAEESTQSSANHSNSFGMSLRTTRGAKFELEREPGGRGEARPLSSSEGSRQEPPVTPDEQPAEAPSGVTKKLFRRLFRP